MEEKNGLENVGVMVATAEPVDHGAAIADLDRRIREVEAAIGDLRSLKALGEPVAAGRKTVGTGQVSLLAKGAGEPQRDASVDDALRSLSVEQRIAVKSGLLRAGLLR